MIRLDPKQSIGSIALTMTPQTLLVDPAGRVRRSWTGAFTDVIRDEVEKELAVRPHALAEATGGM
jgi:hypothetical protein